MSSLNKLELFELLNDLVIKPLSTQNFKLWLFGSRARGDNEVFSDVDLLVSGDIDAFRKIVGTITENIEESNFPYKVDLVHELDVAESYRNKINNEKIAVI